MANVFDSARLTFCRAEHHINEFKSMIDGFVNNSPWTRLVDTDSKPGKHVHKIKITRDLPQMLPCILFDAANNLRAVLDQAGYASAVAANSPSLKAVKFPFGPDEAHWRNNMAGGCKDLPTEIRTIFEGFKAYKGGNNTLWALNEIANTKKHCALIPLEISTPIVTFTAAVPLKKSDSSPVTIEDAPILGAGWDATKREVELAICPANVEPQISGHFSFTVAIEDIDTLRRQDARRVLNAMRNEVRNALLATEAECRDLGFDLSD
jgi:hypothetical protein